jgi:hypothetical protein
MPNGTTIQSSHTCNLLLTDLPPQARQAHILPGLVHSSLISVGQLCNNECSVTFTQDQVTVSKNGKHLLYGSRDPKSRLWRVNLIQKFETENLQCNHAHDNNNQKDLINYIHAACFSPVKSDKLLPLPQPPVRARMDARTNPSAQRATQLGSVLACVCTMSQYRTKLLLMSHNFSNVMINNTSTNEAH